MSTAISVYHGKFGRACLYQMNRRMIKHAHREGHLTFLVEGAPAVQNVGNRQYHVSQEGGCAINSWEPHDFIPAENEVGSLFLVLYIKPIWFLEAARFPNAALHFGRTQVEVTNVISHSIRKVVLLLLDGISTDFFDGYLYELAQECFDQTCQWQGTLPTLGSAGTVFMDYRVRKSIRFLTEQLGNDIQLDDVARSSGLSRPHFYKLFRMQTGVTPNVFFSTLRMERAIERLTQTDSTVTDVGLDLGFSSHSAFTRFFCSNVGMAPSAYRRVAHVIT